MDFPLMHINLFSFDCIYQESKIDSYLDDDAESHKSDSSRPSTSRSPRDIAMETTEMPVTKV